MAAEFLVRVIGNRATDVHRSRNMAEQLHVEFERRGYGTTSDPDTMTTELTVRVKHKRDLGNARMLIDEIVARHLMEDDVEIQRL
jgi:hypothetical protein